MTPGKTNKEWINEAIKFKGSKPQQQQQQTTNDNVRFHFQNTETSTGLHERTAQRFSFKCHNLNNLSHNLPVYCESEETHSSVRLNQLRDLKDILMRKN